MVGIAVDVELDHDDAGIDRVGSACSMPNLSRRSASGTTLAADIDQPVDEGLGARHLGDRHQIEDFAHAARASMREDLALQLQGQHLERFASTFAFIAALPQLAALSRSSCAWPCSTRCGMSRMSATVPSPRMVAPENDLTSAVQLRQRLDDGLVVADAPGRRRGRPARSPAETIDHLLDTDRARPCEPNRSRSRRKGTSSSRMLRKLRPRERASSSGGSSTHSSTADSGMT